MNFFKIRLSFAILPLLCFFILLFLSKPPDSFAQSCSGGPYRCYDDLGPGCSTGFINRDCSYGDYGVFCVDPTCCAYGGASCTYNPPAGPTPTPGGGGGGGGCTFQGFKLLMPGNQNTTPASTQTVTVSGWGSTTNQPYVVGVSAGTRTVSVSVPAGYTVGYTACTNDTSCHGNTPTMGSSWTGDCPANGYVDLYWHYYQVGTIQGYKLLMPGNQNTTPASTQTVTISGWGSTTSQPYAVGALFGNRTVSVSVPAGYTVCSSLCLNDVSCHGSCNGAGSSRTFDVPPGGFADLWWHYTPPASPTLTPTPTSIIPTLTPTPTVTPIFTPTPTLIPTITPTPTPSACTCSGNLTPDAVGPLIVGAVSPFSMTVSNVSSGCSVTRVDFLSTNTSVATVSPASDFSSLYGTTATVVGSGGTSIRGEVIMSNGAVGCSDMSGLTANVALSSVTLSATATCDGLPTPEVDLTWTSSSGATNYRVYRCTGAACVPSAEIASVAGLTYTDLTAASGTTYRYSVRAFRSSDSVFSPYSNIVTVNPTCASCNVNLIGPSSLEILNTQPYLVDTTCPTCSVNGTIDRINYTSSNPSGISICSSGTPTCPVGSSSSTQLTGPFSMRATAYTVAATSTLRAGVIMDSIERCFSSIIVGVSNVAPWWQAEGNVTAQGDIQSTIPITAQRIPLTALNAYLIVDNDADIYPDPGVLTYNGSIDLGVGGAAISSTNQSSLTVLRYRPAISYASLYSKLPADVLAGWNMIPGNTFNLSTALATANQTRGYYVFYYNGASGDLTLSLNSPYTIPDLARVVVLVENSNVIIATPITSTTIGRSSFLLVSEGNITVDPSVGHTLVDRNNPDLEGVFYTDGTFTSGTGGSSDLSLHLRGAIAAGAYDLQREPANIGSNIPPGEYFEYGTEQVFAFPPFLRYQPNFWREEVL